MQIVADLKVAPGRARTCNPVIRSHRVSLFLLSRKWLETLHLPPPRIADLATSSAFLRWLIVRSNEEFLGLTLQQAEELLERVRADDEETIRKNVGAFGATLKEDAN
jgi:hypothetical protein